jgi:hypothetical protein
MPQVLSTEVEVIEDSGDDDFVLGNTFHILLKPL